MFSVKLYWWNLYSCRSRKILYSLHFSLCLTVKLNQSTKQLPQKREGPIDCSPLWEADKDAENTQGLGNPWTRDSVVKNTNKKIEDGKKKKFLTFLIIVYSFCIESICFYILTLRLIWCLQSCLFKLIKLCI